MRSIHSSSRIVSYILGLICSWYVHNMDAYLNDLIKLMENRANMHMADSVKTMSNKSTGKTAKTEQRLLFSVRLL
mgnify:CR=1 FL=1